MFKWLKGIFMGLLGILFTLPVFAQREENKGEIESVKLSKEEQSAKVEFSKDELIKSLRAMRRNPEEIKTICAMCYEMAVALEEVEFQCDKCGHTAIYSGDSDQGALVKKLPYMKRSLAQMPYRISLDSTGLCPICGKGKNKVLLMKVCCFNCGKEFSWEVKNQEDLNMFRWLYLKPPIKEIDFAPWDDIKFDQQEEKIRQIADYIYERVFCLECREKIKLQEESDK